MKHLFVFGLILLAGCASGPTMEELEAEAMQTGDWTKVEERELVLARRTGRAGGECPTGYAMLCKAEARDTSENCKCVSRDVYRDMLHESSSNQPANPRRTNQ